ncbi:MAG TPA: hypothetical protein VGG89_07005 [Candidatus Baltobacteraceae bacterium]|jgi:hypothetical protein
MKRSVAFVLSSALFAVALSGCGLTSSPADGLTFTAPSGWQSSPGIMGFMQFWTPSANSDEVLMLFRSPRQVDLSKPIDTKEIMESGKLKDTKIQAQRQVSICGTQPAMFFKGSAESSTGNNADKPHNLEMMMSNGGATYFAMYVYPLDRHPNAQAEDALRELCAKH